MKKEKLRIGFLITVLLILAIAFAGCSKSAKDEALEKVKAVDLKAYMQEDRDAVKEFKSAYEKDLKKAKDDKAAEKIMKQFKKELKTFATKKEKVNTYIKLVKEQIKSLSEDKLNKLDSNKDFDALTTEINGKITEISGTTVEVTASQVETSTPAAKQVVKQQAQATKSGNSAVKANSRASNASSSASKAKQRVWVVDKPAWTETKYKTETYQYTVYRTSDGREFPDYNSAYAYYSDMLDEGKPINFGAVTKTGTRQVPYPVSHPEQGHWEYR